MCDRKFLAKLVILVLEDSKPTKVKGGSIYVSEWYRILSSVSKKKGENGLRDFYDAVIVGGGPAGLSGAIYLARAQYRVLVIEKETIGGQITITSEVVNYPGVPMTDGKKLTEGMRKQAQSFGAEFLQGEVKEIKFHENEKEIVTDKGTIRCFSVLLATGASPRRAGFIGEEEFRGRGVAYCATCDGEFFTGKDVYVVGGGFAAAEEAIFLTRYAKKVTILVRTKQFTCAGSIVDQVMNHPKIEVKFQTKVLEVGGEQTLQYIVTEEGEQKERHRYEGEHGENIGVFVFAGYEPATALFKEMVELNEQGYLVTDRRQQTSREGIYGAGDVCVKELRQVVTAVSDGAIAATSMEKYLFSLYENLGVKREEKPNRTTIPMEQEMEQQEEETAFLSEAMKQELYPIFERFTKNVMVKVYLDSSNLSKEVKGFVEEMRGLSERVSFVTITDKEEKIVYPALSICNEAGKEFGIQFHGVPGGHEFNSFIIALYNAGSNGQPISQEILNRIKQIQTKIKMKIAVSLSCTMCPEVVMSAQRIAIENKNIEAEMYDISHYPALKEQYNIMSVPCVIINEKEVFFGKKGVEAILNILEKIED